MDWLRDFWEEHRTLCIIIIGIIAGAVFIGANLFKQTAGSKETQLVSATSSSLNSKKVSYKNDKEQQNNSAASKKLFYVDIKGAVKKPGVYRVKTGMRVDDAVKAAGGFEELADQNQVNLALKLNDQQIIYIPYRGEFSNKLTTTVEASENSSVQVQAKGEDTGPSQDSNSQIDLNAAKKEDLLKIPGIGEKKAEQILAYRTEHGNFKQLDELKSISGIGEKSFEKLKAYLKVES
ncbi:helix-hairpin-helix domain-containing protein [Liquorilactobacillus oeni]|uniref:ComE operon protein 1 n=1 Tax=Liquorilactobacillus oeni DSM 19972 TaxID=1423777 RepID=A0A0R1MJH5_9LACO|nr:helix-hairpin-helix domain-containing protein [Liquorilactobacillus oeni]KRL04635.1 ComE operon protein 1 [Liquorilactobacillus oeni DSM 19972]